MKIPSVSLCQECLEIWCEFLVRFSECHIFQGLGVRIGKFHKISRQRRREKGKFRADSTLQGVGTESGAPDRKLPLNRQSI